MLTGSCVNMSLNTLLKAYEIMKRTCFYCYQSMSFLADGRIFFYLIDLVSSIIGSIKHRDGFGRLIIDVVEKRSGSN